MSKHAMREMSVGASVGARLRVGGLCAFAGLTVGLVGMQASAQTRAIGPRAGQQPDVIVSSVAGSYDAGSADNYGSMNGISAYAIGSDSCNIGSAVAIWVDPRSSGAGIYNTQHPVIGGAVYRLYQGKFEQIGVSWLKHGFCAADSCGSSGNGCKSISPSPVSGNLCQRDFGSTTGNCDWLGYGRATDTYSAGLNGGQGYLGPRSEVNPFTGAFPYPWVNLGANSSCLNKRLLISTSDINPTTYPRYNATTNPTGAQFFAEVVYITSDEWATERYNNYSYRPVNFATTTSNPSSGAGNNCTGAGAANTYAMSFGGVSVPTVPLKPAIEAWRAADPTVRLVTVDAPNDGRFYVACKVTNNNDGTWLYDYAVFNMNSDRGAGSFVVPTSTRPGLTVTFPTIAFKGANVHSGENWTTTPWSETSNSGNVTFATDTYANNPNASAIRWSQMYNLRFTANRGPVDGTATLGLFKNAVQPGDASTLSVPGLQVPSQPPCPGDYNNSGDVTVQDILDYVSGWLAGCTGVNTPSGCAGSADFNGVNGINVQDLLDFFSAWLNPCV